MKEGRPDKTSSIELVSQGEAAELLNVSVPSIKRAKVVLDAGAPVLVEKVQAGAVAVSTAAEIASLPQEEQREIVARGEAEILKAAKEIRQQRKEQNEQKRIEILSKPVALPPDKYRCIIIDPPWPMQKIERDERPNQVGFDYPTMTEEQLRDFPLARIAAEDCHLYLWTTHKFIPMALRLAEHWGFRYQCLLTWVKNVGFTPFSWMYSTEHVLFCRKGSLDLLVKGKRLDFQAKVREHSRKPDEFYDLIRLVSPEPRIDIFSREAREGFAQYGKETEKFTWQQAG